MLGSRHDYLLVGAGEAGDVLYPLRGQRHVCIRDSSIAGWQAGRLPDVSIADSVTGANATPTATPPGPTTATDKPVAMDQTSTSSTPG